MEKLNIQSLLNNYCLVVPEIQREYVWGSKSNKLVLSQFLKDIDDKLGKGETNIGFLYSYKSGEEHYLIDGQQRFTTLILLLHYCTVKEGEQSHNNYIQMHHLDRNIIAFSYRVRSHTESFLKNLLLSNAINSKMIKQQKWYKSIYADDATVCSMLDALDIIDEKWDTLININSANILEHIFFWYFDVERTSQGEELYITMNSRGEKLTDSEQIKPRLLNKIKDVLRKEEFGTKWDRWEEFFFRIRNGRKIESIDAAMNNIIRVVLELTTLKEHDRINAIEDAELISLEDIETYMISLEKLSQLSNGKYCSEIERLFGDKEGDGNYIVLKTLLIETIKKQEDCFEYERVFQTITNNVRRNKIKNLDLLQFLKEYRGYEGTLYDFILHSNNGVVSKIINGHELEKVIICSSTDNIDYEKSIWEEQSCAFWNGEMKSMIAWSKKDGLFSFELFEKTRKNFHKLFPDNLNKEDWTTDNVRQALIASRLPHYPLNDKFGWYRDEWKEIIAKNEQEFLQFLNLFDDIDTDKVSIIIESLKSQYVEIPNNQWAEFVKKDYLLNYCNTKHMYWQPQYGWVLVKNSWAKPISVKNMHLYHSLLEKYGEEINGWYVRLYQSWDSCVYIQNDKTQVFIDVRYLRKNDDTYYLKVDLSQRNITEELKTKLLRYMPTGLSMSWDTETERYLWYPESIEALFNFISYSTSVKE